MTSASRRVVVLSFICSLQLELKDIRGPRTTSNGHQASEYGTRVTEVK